MVREPEPVDPAPAEATSDFTADDREVIEHIDRDRAEETLRARIRGAERRRVGADAADETASTWATRYRPPSGNDDAAATVPADAGPGLTGLLWRLRFAIIGLLLVGAAAYAFTVVSGIGAPSGVQQSRTVGLGQRVSGDRWDYVVNGVQRTDTAGKAQARGTYYVVRLGITNNGAEGAQIAPSQFLLIDANGVEYRAESLASGAYNGSDNTASPYVWPQSFGAGRSVTVGVLFDIDRSAPLGMQLAFADIANTRVRLD